jgi:hypothetical protein
MQEPAANDERRSGVQGYLSEALIGPSPLTTTHSEKKMRQKIQISTYLRRFQVVHRELHCHPVLFKKFTLDQFA